MPKRVALVEAPGRSVVVWEEVGTVLVEVDCSTGVNRVAVSSHLAVASSSWVRCSSNWPIPLSQHSTIEGSQQNMLSARVTLEQDTMSIVSANPLAPPGICC